MIMYRAGCKVMGRKIEQKRKGGKGGKERQRQVKKKKRDVLGDRKGVKSSKQIEHCWENGV